MNQQTSFVDVSPKLVDWIKPDFEDAAIELCQLANIPNDLVEDWCKIFEKNLEAAYKVGNLHGRQEKKRPLNRRCIPGTSGKGPPRQTCGSCLHKRYAGGVAGQYLKCGLVEKNWTHGEATGIKARWPACEKWEVVQ